MTGKSIVFIGGSSGSGKTTTATELNKTLRTSENFRFCKAMDREADRLGLSQLDLLQQWYYLQTLLIKNLIAPKISENKTIIFDLHYSHPLSDDPKIVFSRRHVPLKHDFCMRLGNDFLRKLVQANVPLFLFLLRADEHVLQSRLMHDAARDNRDYMSSLEMIRKEQSSELESYCRTINALKGFGATVEHIEIENVENMHGNTIQMMLRKIGGNDGALLAG